MEKLNTVVSFAEICLYGGKPEGLRSHNVPIDASASWEIRNEKELAACFTGELPVYARISGSETQKYVENKICAMETMSMDGGGAKARLHASGMAAVTSALLGATKPGDNIVIIGPVYGGTYDMLKFLKDNGRVVKFFAARDPELAGKIEKELSSCAARIVFGELTCNPTIDVWDVCEVADICKRHNSILAVDTSFLSPYNARPFEFGADIVVHSSTKYLGGRGAFVSGLSVASPKFLASGSGLAVWEKMNSFSNCTGATPGVFETWLLGIFMEDLHLRIPTQNANAMALATHLRKHKNVLGVMYPMISNEELAEKVIRPADGGKAYGAMLTIRVRGGIDSVKKFLLKMTNRTYVKHKPSLGYTKTIIESPWILSQAFVSDEDKKLFGITDDLVRISVGTESTGYILEAFDFGLSEIW